MSDGDGLDLATSLPVGAARLRAELGSADPMTEYHRQEAWNRTSEIVSQVAGAVGSVPGSSRRTLLSGGTSRASRDLQPREEGNHMSTAVPR